MCSLSQYAYCASIVTDITTHVWTAAWNKNTWFTSTTGLQEVDWIVLFWKSAQETGCIPARLTPIRALSLPSSSCHLWGALTWEEKSGPVHRPLAVSLLPSVFSSRACDLDWILQTIKLDVFDRRSSFVSSYLLRRSDAEWEKVESGMKLGLARHVGCPGCSGRGGSPLSWCQRPRWVRLEHHGGKKETFPLSSRGGAALRELHTSPQNR